MTDPTPVQINAQNKLTMLRNVQSTLDQYGPMREVLEAAAAGKPILFHNDKKVWEDGKDCDFSAPASCYRIKPPVVRSRRYLASVPSPEPCSDPAARQTIVCTATDLPGYATPESIVKHQPNFIAWIDSDWVEHEIPTKE